MGAGAIDPAGLRHRFAYHPSSTGEVQTAHELVRQEAYRFAKTIDTMASIPECREKSLAITHIEDAMMWANAAIARHQ